MGWRLTDTLDLLFLDEDGQPDPIFDRCEITARQVTIDEYTAVTDLIGAGGLVAIRKQRDRIAEVADLVCSSIDQWNLAEPDGTQTPINGTGLMSHPKAVTFAVINAWVAAQREGPRPFAAPSSSGGPAVEIPATPLAS